MEEHIPDKGDDLDFFVEEQMKNRDFRSAYIERMDARMATLSTGGDLSRASSEEETISALNAAVARLERRLAAVEEERDEYRHRYGPLPG